MTETTGRVKRSAPDAAAAVAAETGAAGANAQLGADPKKQKTIKRPGNGYEPLLLTRGAVAMFYSKSKNLDDLGE